MLPAQNATGNWIKVVQRVPVRIELDAKQLAAHPLRVGLSMEATVDLHETSGAPVLSAQLPPRASSRTAVFDTSNAEADRHDAEFWQRLDPGARVLYAWQLSVEQWALLGRTPDEPGLCRSVARLHRR